MKDDDSDDSNEPFLKRDIGWMIYLWFWNAFFTILLIAPLAILDRIMGRTRTIHGDVIDNETSPED